MSEVPARAAEGPGSDWYRYAGQDLEQGDILIGFRLVVPIVTTGADYTFGARQACVIVLTQTCDVQKAAQKDLLVAEVHSYDDLLATNQAHLRKREYKQALARGSAISDFLLPPSPGGEIGWSIVGFRNISIVPKESLQVAGQTRQMLRLVSPYKEYLSQAFGRFVMRVGLPETLNAFEQYTG